MRKLRIYYLRSQIENEIFLYAKFSTHASLKNAYKLLKVSNEQFTSKFPISLFQTFADNFLDSSILIVM